MNTTINVMYLNLHFQGDECGIHLNMCLSSPCENGATCENGYNTYTCTCAPGFTGPDCEEVNDCTASNSTNNSSCLRGTCLVG